MTQSHPSLADMSCYNEVVQLEVMGLFAHVDTKFPKVAAWLKRMTVQYRGGTRFGSCMLSTEASAHLFFQTLPFHDEQLAPMMAFFRKYKLIPSSKM